MLISNYHTYAKRGSHSGGTDEEYVEEGISYSIRNLGFSEHIILPGFNEEGIRGNYSLFDDYSNLILKLQKNIKNK